MMMGPGAVLAGVGILLVLLTYVTQPFRAQRVDADRAIETWVDAVKADLSSGATAQAPEPPKVPASQEAVNYCPYCGRRVSEDFRFCPGCGKPLEREETL